MSIFDQIFSHPWGPPAFENDNLESAVTLYGMTHDESLKRKIQQHYRNGCNNVSNLAVFLAAAKEHPDLLEICLNQAKCSSHDICPTIARGLKPEVLLQVLESPSSQQQLSGSHASLLVAACCTAAETCMSLNVFRQLTDASILPNVDCMAAVFLLALECDYGSISRSLSSASTMTTSLRSRCIPAIAREWNYVEAALDTDTELAQAWDKIPPEVQAQCMLQATTIPSHLEGAQDQEGFESLPCAQSLALEDDSDDCDDDSDISVDEIFLPYVAPKCIPSEIPLKVVPRNGRLGARDALFQGYCLYSSKSTTDVKLLEEPLEPQAPAGTEASPGLLRSLWETVKLSTSKTNLFQMGTSTSEPQHMILYTTMRHCKTASSA
jgi:hypothetical protein